jgi:spore coat polysaccharide biosynthesis predicted glycosyltransferase SpsG
MRYVFWADASPLIGSGHVMRSSAIAEEMIRRGLEVVSIGAITGLPWVSNRIENLGYSRVVIDPIDFDPNPKSDILIIDSYGLPVNHDFLAESNWHKIISIVDEQTPYYGCNLAIHPGLSIDWINKFDTKLLSGPMYIPFRSSIKVTSSESLNSELKIIVVGGGTNTNNFVGALANLLSQSKLNFAVHLFMNKNLPSKLDARFTAVPIGPRLDEIANSANLVFSTASTTSLEFIARNIPTGIGCSIDNQESYYNNLTAHEVALPIGKFENSSWEFNLDAIQNLLVSKELRMKLTQNCKNLIDLNGAKRIVNEILLLN